LKTVFAPLLLAGILAACSTTSTPPTPVSLYNPDASVTESTDTRVPYQGDWVMIASLADGTTRYGTLSVSARATGLKAITNAGGGVLGWTTTSTATSNDEVGTVLIGTVNVNGSGRLFASMTPRGSGTSRLYFEDYDGKVETIQGKATLGGEGDWTTPGSTTSQSAVYAFVQLSGTPSVKAQGLSSATDRAQATAVALDVLAKLRAAHPQSLLSPEARPAAQP